MKKAFTLIELLIVVAIIAILAAIAVPNFLEAQTRAKVSSVKSNQRTISTAVESYIVDNNNLPDLDLWALVFRLTSPIAYLSTVPDPGDFDEKSPIYGRGTTLGEQLFTTYGMIPPIIYNRDFQTRAFDVYGGSPSPESYIWITETTFLHYAQSANYMQWSNGPFGGNAFEEIGDPGFGNIWIAYDPTNGTVSPGLIMRIGGSVTVN